MTEYALLQWLWPFPVSAFARLGMANSPIAKETVMQDDIELIRKTLDETPIWDACDKATDRIISKLENGAAEKAFQDALKDHDFNQEVMRTGLEIAYIDIDFKAGWEAHAARSGWVAIEDILEEWKDGRPLDVWDADMEMMEHGFSFVGECFLCDSYGRVVDDDEDEDVRYTHAKLPIAPPQSKGGE